MDNTSRAKRRHHRNRMLNRALKHELREVIRYAYPDLTRQHIDQAIRRAYRTYNNRTACSCNLCCNDRHNPWFSNKDKLTIQERKEYARFHYELEEYYTPNVNPDYDN